MNESSNGVQIEVSKYIRKRGIGEMKCPKCGCESLQAVSDVQGKGASFWKICFCGLLGLCGTGKTKTTHYWVCNKCGHKFKM